MFLKNCKANINVGTGYLFIVTNKKSYHPGDTIKGSVFFELFHECASRELEIEFKGLSTITPSKYSTNNGVVNSQKGKNL